MILSFSGTGNSLYIARALEDKLNMEMLDLFQSIKNLEYKNIESKDPFVIVSPIYSWRIPRFLSDYLEKIKLKGNKEIYFVTNCGDSMGNAQKYNRILAKKLGMDYMGSFEILMPENYLLLFKVPDKEEEDQIMDKASKKISEVAEIIKNNRKIEEKPINIIGKAMSGIINPVSYRLIVKSKKFFTSDKCISCGICEKKCILNNIELIDGKPVWSDNCTHCCACISYCPVHAIDYGKITRGKRRYICRTYK